MSNSLLLVKSQENKRAADLLEQEKLYNAATSRIYYSSYQLVLHILSKNNKTAITSGGGSHKQTITMLVSDILTTPSERSKVQKLIKVRKDRNKCDYENNFNMIDTDYSMVKKKVEDAISVLNNYS